MFMDVVLTSTFCLSKLAYAIHLHRLVPSLFVNSSSLSSTQPMASGHIVDHISEHCGRAVYCENTQSAVPTYRTCRTKRLNSIESVPDHTTH
ncbi:hypothetical protein B0T12DRAFT_409261 [Alternaria alternata]|nr:hypothetical protein B0T12DRAFT_409261 [Alternaria alternata]